MLTAPFSTPKAGALNSLRWKLFVFLSGALAHLRNSETNENPFEI